MENRRNYYRILQVQPDAPAEIIRASYRTLMQRLRAHPDLGGDHWNAAIINEAYAVLGNPQKRARYDRAFRTGLQRKSATGTGQLPPDAVPDASGHCLFCGTPHRCAADRRPAAVCARCGSPLHRSTVRRLAGRGQRAIDRLPRHHALRLYTVWPQPHGCPAESRDLSLNGISFVTAELLAPRAIVKIDSDVCNAVVEVMNLRVEDDGADGLWLVGARFLSVIFTRTRGAFLSARA